MPEQSEHIIEESSPVNEIVGAAPGKLISYGSGAMFFMVMIIISLCFIIKYPEVIESQLVVSDENAPQPIFAKASKRIVSLLKKEGEEVKMNDHIVLLESIEDYKQLNDLSIILDSMEKRLDDKNYMLALDSLLMEFDQLGNLQDVFNQFQFKLMDYQMHLHESFNAEVKENLEKKIEHAQLSYLNFVEQKKLLAKEVELFERDYMAYKTMQAEGLVSQKEVEEQVGILTLKKLSYRQMNGSMLSAKSLLLSLKDELIQHEKTFYVAQTQLKQGVKSLESAIQSWEDLHVIKANSNGMITYSSTIGQGEMIAANTPFAYILTGEQKVIGELFIPQANLGKVKLGQKVNVKLHSYPHTEYGMIIGKVDEMSQMVNEQGMYRLAISFDNGLKTNFDKEIEFKNGLMANAEIITEDQYIIQRLLYQFKELLQ